MKQIKLAIVGLAVSLCVFLPGALAPSLLKAKAPQPVNQTDVTCLAKNIYHEARGEPVEGRIAVALVTLNRVKHERYGNTVCKVVYAYKQFSWTLNKHKQVADHKAWQESLKLARAMLAAPELFKPFSALYFHTKQVKPYWSKNKQIVAVIGNHIFYN